MRLLDLFCGEGLAAWGYWRSGCFSEIVGVDINPKCERAYAFDFVCADVLTLDYDFLLQFDFIHASPPCQGYSKATPKEYRANHPRLIPDVHLLCKASGLPHVIENVEGSGQELRPNVRLNGHAVGLPLDRPRYFHVSQLTETVHRVGRGEALTMHGGTATRAEMIQAMGLQTIPKFRRKRLSKRGIEEGIPPAMTQFIAGLVLPKYRVA